MFGSFLFAFTLIYHSTFRMNRKRPFSSRLPHRLYRFANAPVPPQAMCRHRHGSPNRDTGARVEKLALLSQTGLPIHLSEITITAPNDDTRGRLIQAVIAYNLYRLWFSTEKMAGITWWNSVDGCASKNEPSTSGLFTRDMQPKPSFFALDRLINHEWKTNIERAADNDGHLRFRGFKGTYRISWTDRKGNTQSMEYTAK